MLQYDPAFNEEQLKNDSIYVPPFNCIKEK